MPKPAKHKVVIIGCGNVAWHIAKQLTTLKTYSLSVYNHKANVDLIRFSKELKCETHVGLKEIREDGDFYFICVADQFIPVVSKKITCNNPDAIILHTAGSVEVNEIKNKCANKGVFYPLQTFSKNDVVEWAALPIILEGNNLLTKKNIKALADNFSKKTLFLKYRERLRLHLCAVMVNNFTNALFVAAAGLLDKKNSSGNFKLLLPLIQQTAKKLDVMSPHDAQTGPAKRNDTVVLKKHLGILSDKKQLKKIYTQMSKLILSQQNTYA